VGTYCGGNNHSLLVLFSSPPTHLLLTTVRGEVLAWAGLWSTQQDSLWSDQWVLKPGNTSSSVKMCWSPYCCLQFHRRTAAQAGLGLFPSSIKSWFHNTYFSVKLCE